MTCGSHASASQWPGKPTSLGRSHVAEEIECGEEEASRVDGSSCGHGLDGHIICHDKAEVLTVDSILEDIGIGRAQAGVIALCGMAWFSDAVEATSMAYVQVNIDDAWGTQLEDWGHLNSAKALAGVVGAFSCGVVSDRVGRRVAFLAALTIIALSGPACAFAQGFRQLMLLRLLVNAGTAGLLPVAISLLSEHIPASSRDAFVAGCQLFFVSGKVSCIAMSWFIHAMDISWRVFLLAVSLPSVVLLGFARYVPESAAHLLLQENEAELQHKLTNMASRNGNLTEDVEKRIAALVKLSSSSSSQAAQEAAIGLSSSQVEEAATVGQRSTGLRRLVLSPKLRGAAIAVCLCWVFSSAGSDSFGWVTEIAKVEGVAQTQVDKVLLVCQLISFLGLGSSALLARGNRGPSILILALASCTVLSSLIAVSINIHTPLAFSATLLVFYEFPFSVVWSLIYAITASKFDASCRASSISLGSACSRFSGSVVPPLSAFLLEKHYGFAFIFWASAWLCATVAGLSMSMTASGERKHDSGRHLMLRKSKMQQDVDAVGSRRDLPHIDNELPVASTECSDDL